MKKTFEVLHLSMRGYHKILRVARTIADIEEQPIIDIPHLQEAIMYRSLDQSLEKYSPMIKGIGIDSVEVARFAHWYSYPHASLRRIFSNTEIDYCLARTAQSSAHFAARFAAREAFLKH